MSYTRLSQNDIVISAEPVITSAWTGNLTALDTFFTSSAQENTNSGKYYLEVYQKEFGTTDAEIQLSLAYCDKVGSGSIYINDSVSGITPTSINYGTYRSIILGNEEEDFKFGNVSSSFFFAISLDRARYKEKIKPDTVKIVLKNGSTELELTPITGQVETYLDSGRTYDLKGKLGLNDYTIGSPLFNMSGSYGKLLPDIGVILLNGQALNAATSIGGLNLGIARQPNQDNRNTRKLFLALKELKIQSEETLSSNFIFLRVGNADYNYSSNPSYITGSGDLRFTQLIDDPKAYFTSVGLYNDNNDLLAVAKLSRPLLKDSRKEALIRIKLDF
jgi:hypothetical protein